MALNRHLSCTARYVIRYSKVYVLLGMALTCGSQLSGIARFIYMDG